VAWLPDPPPLALNAHALLNAPHDILDKALGYRRIERLLADRLTGGGRWPR
jgi:hypothetical protein